MSAISEALERLEEARAVLLLDLGKIEEAIAALGGVKPPAVTIASVSAGNATQRITAMITALLTDGEPHTTRAIVRVVGDGTPEPTIHGVLGNLLRDGIAVRISRGVYQSAAAVALATELDL